MGFFDRKKVRKTASEPVPVKPAPVNAAGHHHALLPAPPASRYATSTTQTPTYWQPQPHQQQPQYHHPPPPYHRPQQEVQYQHHVQQQQQHHPQEWAQQPQRAPYPQPIVVNQHYYLHPPPSSHLALAAPSTAAASQSGAGANTCPSGLDKFAGSVVTIAKDFASPHFLEEPNFHPHATQLINSTAACVDQIAGCFNDVMTLIDRDRLVGNEKALFSYQQDGSAPPGEGKRGADGGGGGRGAKSGKGASGAKKRTKEKDSSSKVQSTAVATSVVSGNYFAKVELYANSRLPMNLPPLKLYMATWPLLCMAAQYAERVYEHPKGAERDAHVSADWRTGTKAMVIKSVPMDHVSTIVFAIRGSATFMDWAVNLNSAPASPAGFLDDPGNSCHAGFLAVARKTVRPVAARLRQLLEEDPARGAYSLLITGHSAGGAVASLLYAHMLATSPQAESELNPAAAAAAGPARAPQEPVPDVRQRGGPGGAGGQGVREEPSGAVRGAGAEGEGEGEGEEAVGAGELRAGRRREPGKGEEGGRGKPAGGQGEQDVAETQGEQDVAGAGGQGAAGPVGEGRGQRQRRQEEEAGVAPTAEHAQLAGSDRGAARRQPQSEDQGPEDGERASGRGGRRADRHGRGAAGGRVGGPRVPRHEAVLGEDRDSCRRGRYWEAWLKGFRGGSKRGVSWLKRWWADDGYGEA
ncbi:putative vegetative cell wall protein gp1 [Colletotrichum sublineola]|uniref:Putative vegetative cell wall protein gp1 n=1 Tax=Colletotrichum sublineola TaxID=1173701 RepID=A0A066XN12_COLSU|nr:putative vegetative cell wall protein gp1 [Colletotrichum sublineola]